MDRPTAIKRLKRILEVKSENLDMYDKEALKMALVSLETDEAYQLEYEQPTVKLLIDIPKEDYGLAKKGLVKKYSAYQIYKCISNGIVVDDKENK